MPRWTDADLKAYEQRQAKSGNRPERVHADIPKPNKLLPLDGSQEREEARWYGPAKRFEITFRIYSTHPCDWDGHDIKRLQDWCVTAGIIPSDKWDVVSGRVCSEKVRQKGEEKTVIEITPI